MSPFAEQIIDSEKEEVEILYKKLNKGIHDIEKGDLISHEETMRMIRSGF